MTSQLREVLETLYEIAIVRDTPPLVPVIRSVDEPTLPGGSRSVEILTIPELNLWRSPLRTRSRRVPSRGHQGPL